MTSSPRPGNPSPVRLLPEEVPLWACLCGGAHVIGCLGARERKTNVKKTSTSVRAPAQLRPRAELACVSEARAWFKRRVRSLFPFSDTRDGRGRPRLPGFKGHRDQSGSESSGESRALAARRETSRGARESGDVVDLQTSQQLCRSEAAGGQNAVPETGNGEQPSRNKPGNNAPITR